MHRLKKKIELNTWNKSLKAIELQLQEKSTKTVQEGYPI